MGWYDLERMPDKSAPPTRVGYIPTLDGWRALAVFAVIIYHDKVRRIGPISDSFVHKFGHLGVDLFFAISGILICSRLLDEEYSNHQISLSGFYIRRFCRILPPAWLFLGTLAVLGIAHVVPVGLSAWFAAFAFVQNYYQVHLHSLPSSLVTDAYWYTGHFWSLAVEEHFYLILPGILYLFRKSRIAILVSIIVVVFVYGVIIHSNPAWIDLMGGGESAIRRTELRINALLFPALLAILLRKHGFHRFSMRWLRPVVVIPVLGFLFGAVALFILKAHLANSGLILLLADFGFPFLILCTMLHPASYISRFLELRPLRHLGKISYSIYLWQQLFFIREQTSISATWWPIHALQSFPWSLIAVLVIANASYYFVERPFMRLGHRLAPPATPGRSELKAVPS